MLIVMVLVIGVFPLGQLSLLDIQNLQDKVILNMMFILYSIQNQAPPPRFLVRGVLMLLYVPLLHFLSAVIVALLYNNRMIVYLVSSGLNSMCCLIFLQPAAVLGFAGLAAFFHYNDERRAVPKGICYLVLSIDLL